MEKNNPPARSFFIAFGHDEEVRNLWGKLGMRRKLNTGLCVLFKVSGKRGAQELAKALRARGVKRLDFVLDEGFPVAQNVFPGTDRPVAL